MICQSRFGLVDLDQESWWLCTTCNMCMSCCPRGVGITDIMGAVRSIMLVEGSVLRVGDNDLLNTGGRPARYVQCGQEHAVAAQGVTVTAEGLSVTDIDW
jgi:heterodisulfide reductase subunit C